MKITPSLPTLPPQTPRLPVLATEPIDTFTSWTSAAAGAVAGAMVEGVGMAGITLLHTPAGVKKAYHDLFTSEHGALYKGGWSLGIVAAATLATPLAGVIGAGLGAYGGRSFVLAGLDHTLPGPRPVGRAGGSLLASDSGRRLRAGRLAWGCWSSRQSLLCLWRPTVRRHPHVGVQPAPAPPGHCRSGLASGRDSQPLAMAGSAAGAGRRTPGTIRMPDKQGLLIQVG